jgi:carbon-monoxide dehydrogenase medium subunit
LGSSSAKKELLMIAPFVLHRPSSLPAALALLSEHQGATKILAGGSELLLLLKMGLIKAEHIVDIKKIPGIDHLAYDAARKTLRIGPLVTHRTLEKSALVQREFPLLAEMERELANVRIRNVGTLAGNLCFAEPHADPAALLAVYEASVTLRSAEGERRIGIDDFYTDYFETAVQENELLTNIELPKPADGFRGAYLRFCPGEWPMVTAALLTRWADGACVEARLALGCVGPKPVRVSEFEEALRGKSANELAAKADELAAIAARSCDPLADLWGSVEYKRQIVNNLVRDGLRGQCDGRVA